MSYKIYCYTNQITGQKYVGCTCRKQDRRAGKNGYGYKVCPKFNEAIQQYGWNNFEYSVLEDNLDKEQSELREQFWISELNTIFPNGYNLQSGGKHFTIDSEYSSMYGQHHSEESIRKISDSKKGDKNPMYGRTGEKNPFYGQHHTEEAKQKIAERTREAMNRPEVRQKQSDAKKGKPSNIKGRKWFNNGTKNVMAYECPEGWFPGRLRKITN